MIGGNGTVSNGRQRWKKRGRWREEGARRKGPSQERSFTTTNRLVSERRLALPTLLTVQASTSAFRLILFEHRMEVFKTRLQMAEQLALASCPIVASFGMVRLTRSERCAREKAGVYLVQPFTFPPPSVSSISNTS